MTAQNTAARHIAIIRTKGVKAPIIETYDSKEEMLSFLTVYLRRLTVAPTRVDPATVEADPNVTIHGAWRVAATRTQPTFSVVAATIDYPMQEHVRVVTTVRDSKGGITRQTESAAMTVTLESVVDDVWVGAGDGSDFDAIEAEFEKQLNAASENGKHLYKRLAVTKERLVEFGPEWNGMTVNEATVKLPNGGTSVVTEVSVPNAKTSAFFRPKAKLKAI